ncbi:MAG: sortase [Patescibacteria group bacterium]|nr:sortase [Patescibacteria group bacterium]
MPPENLPTIENMENNHGNHESDWWIFEKISQTETFQDFRNNRFFKPFKTDKWWNFSLSIKVLILLACIGLVFAYQNRPAIYATFPNTITAFQKINIIPELFTEVGIDLESRYSLSSILISLENRGNGEGSGTVTTPSTSVEKPIKVIIDKIGVKSAVTNPTSKNIITLNDALKLGAVRYPDSGLLDEDKNVFIFGHSTSLTTDNTYYKTFNDLDKLVVGDKVKLQSANYEYTYKVLSVAVTNTRDGLVKFDDNKELILSTCNTLGQKEERIIVRASYVGKVSLASGGTSNPVTPQPGTGSDSIYEVINDPSIPSNSNGFIDFAATIDSIGILDSNGDFVASSTPNSNSKIAVKFTIKNIGDKKSEGWYFNAVLPTSPFHIFHSKSQQALAPGEKIEFTMGFDRPKVGENQLVVINVDPTKGIKESDKDNNIVKEFVTIVE